MTLADLKNYFRTQLKVVAGGPTVGTPGQNRAAGVLAALDKMADFANALVLALADTFTIRDIYDVPLAVRTAVVAGDYTGSGSLTGEMQGAQPTGSLAGQRFKAGQAIYEFMRGSAGTLVWVRYPVG